MCADDTVDISTMSNLPPYDTYLISDHFTPTMAQGEVYNDGKNVTIVDTQGTTSVPDVTQGELDNREFTDEITINNDPEPDESEEE